MATDNLKAFLDPIGFAKAYATVHQLNPRTVITSVPPPPPPPPPSGFFNAFSNLFIGNSTVKTVDKPSTTTITTKSNNPDGPPQIDFTEAVAERAKKSKEREARLDEIMKRKNISLSDAVDVLRKEDEKNQTTKPQIISPVTAALLTEEDIKKKELKKQRNEFRLQRIRQKKVEIAEADTLSKVKEINERYAREDRIAAVTNILSAHVTQNIAY